MTINISFHVQRLRSNGDRLMITMKNDISAIPLINDTQKISFL